MISARGAFALLAATLLAGCASSPALGFRARQAVLRGDAEAFRGLMEEAAAKEPIGPLDNPKKTVLSHFLDLAGDPLFFPLVNDWLERGWVKDEMTCAIHRAHYKAAQAQAPEAQSEPSERSPAERSAAICLERARAAARAPDRAWELEACLEEAPFLVTTSSAAIAPYLALAADPKEPLALRRALLDGLSRVSLIPGAAIDQPSAEARQRAARERHEAQSARLELIVEALRGALEPTLLAGATARGVLEQEVVANSLGTTFVGAYATAEEAWDRALAWAWVRSMKSRKQLDHLAGLGLWDQAREPPGDGYWYLCTRAPEAPPPSAAALLGPMQRVEAISVRAPQRLADLDALRSRGCGGGEGPTYPHVSGPYPLEVVARGAVTASVAESLGEGTRPAVVVKARHLTP